MAIDNTPPRLRLIATIATIMVITLVGLDFVFKSYYAFMTDEAKHEKIAPKTDLVAQLLAEQNAFAGAKVPVDQAMSQVAKGTRPEMIEPKPSEDMAPMTGWSKMPKQPPLPVPAEAHTATAVTPAAADGGADAGPPHAEAGAPPAPAPKDAGARPPGH